MECIRINKNELKIKVSQNELKILDAFKNEMLHLLDDYKENCLSIIDNHLHPYLNDYAKMNELQKMKKDAFESPGFEISFLNVITLNYPKVEFLNDDLFLKFAWFTNLIEDDQIAKLKITDYLLVHFINLQLDEYENGGLNAQKIVFQFPKDNDFYPFEDIEKYNIFIKYVKLHIIEPYLDFSYLYQRLLERKFIKYVKQKDFIKWLFENDFINEKTFYSFDAKGQFYSLNKSTTPQRENNFNNLFKL
jgi:hypothetical protein